jgi:putative methyltransferase (TIGR04325 family)
MRLFIAEVFRRVTAFTGVIDGYEHPELVDEVYRKTLTYEPTEPWPGMVGVSSVLDFGGACGQHYKHARISSPGIRWAVVETPAMIARAAELSTENLKFFSSVGEAAMWLGQIDLVFSSGAVQCTPDPENAARQLCALGVPRIRYERLAFAPSGRIEHDQFSLLGENGPASARSFRGKAVKIKRVLIPREAFVACHDGYRLDDEGEDWMQFSKITA